MGLDAPLSFWAGLEKPWDDQFTTLPGASWLKTLLTEMETQGQGDSEVARKVTRTCEARSCYHIVCLCLGARAQAEMGCTPSHGTHTYSLAVSDLS